MKLTLPLPISKNEAFRSVVGANKNKLFDAVDAYRKGGGGKAAWRTILGAMFVNVTKSKAYRNYEALCELPLAAQRTEVLEGDVSMVVTVYFENRRRDLPNVVDVLLDILEGVCYKNDRQVAHLAFTKAYSKDSPRVEVEVTPMQGELL